MAVSEACAPPPITTVEQLQCYLRNAISLEFSTIPPYLCGAWSIKDQGNECVTLIKSVAITEMRHMAIDCNCLIATGQSPVIANLVPTYPSYLPDGEDEFEVDLLPFGPEFLQKAMLIEQPAPSVKVPEGIRALVAAGKAIPRKHRLLAMGNIFPTIGEFYNTILSGIQYLVEHLGETTVFPNGGNTSQQVAEFNGPITIAGSSDALTLLTDIIDEGEGTPGTMWDENGNLSHYYTFQEISLGRHYQKNDQPGLPSGSPISVPSSDQVVPMLCNPRMKDYVPQTSQVWRDGDAFNRQFQQLVQQLNTVFNGSPGNLDQAIGEMVQLDQPGTGLVWPLFGDSVPNQPGLVAGPTFEIPPYNLQTDSW